MAKRKKRRKTAKETIKEKKLVLVRYGEIFLKSQPVKRKYKKRLKDNIKNGLKQNNVKGSKITRKRGRIFIEVNAGDIKKVLKTLEKTFGVVSFSPCWYLDSAETKTIQKFVKQNYRKWIKRGQTFAVRARRSGTQKQKYTSMDLAKLVGDVVNRKVDLSSPDVEIFVEVRGNKTYICKEVLRGPGGLPVGTAGKVVCLLSGGIDSAVAAWLMMKRGCEIIAVYADNWPYAEDREKSLKRARQILRILQDWSHGRKIRAFYFDHGKNLKTFLENKKTPRKFTCLLCKRMMYRTANELAKKHNAKGIVTGETLGEVASQTLDNLLVLHEASELPVFRPLIGNDKQENINLAKRIGTYNTSISVGSRCKAVPIKPRTKGKLTEIESIESELPIEKLVKNSVKSIKRIKF